MAIEDRGPVQDFYHACTTLSLPTLIDEIAAGKPTRPFVSLPINDEDLSKGYRDVTYSEFARAVDRCAWWIVSLLGRCESKNGRTLAYVGPQDLRYAVLILGAVKGGYTVRFVHQRGRDASEQRYSDEKYQSFKSFTLKLQQSTLSLSCNTPAARSSCLLSPCSQSSIPFSQPSL